MNLAQLKELALQKAKALAAAVLTALAVYGSTAISTGNALSLHGLEAAAVGAVVALYGVHAVPNKPKPHRAKAKKA